MARPFEVHIPLEQAYLRNVLFALEVLDAVTLRRVSQGLKVKAKGLVGKPILNSGGLFVWLKEGNAAPQELDLEPGRLPYEKRTVPGADITLPLTRVELLPRRDYPFSTGITGVLGMLVETRPPPPPPRVRPVPIANASVWLRWLDDDGVTWHDATTRSRTDENGGFAAIVRFAPNDLPRLDANGAVTGRLQVDRAGTLRRSADIPLTQGRVADAMPIFAWDELVP